MQKGGCEFVRTKYCMTQATYTLGIDIGSTTVKIAILDEAHQILFSDYERHFANIQETLAALLEKAEGILGVCFARLSPAPVD